MPQGETMLVQAWLQVLRVQGVPPTACTIVMRRSEPAPIYDFWISGDAIAGAHPDRELFDYVERNRRQPDVAETFVGRIQASTADGQLLDLGWGHLYLAPRPREQAPNPWAPPQAHGWGPQSPPGPPPRGAWDNGAPQGPPPGYPPPYYGGYPPPPYGYPYGPMMGAPPYMQAQPAPQPAAAPPPAPASTDPIVLELYKLQLEAHKEMVSRMGQPMQAAPAQAAASDPWATVERAVGLVQKLMPQQQAPIAAAPEGPSVTVHKLDGGGTIVTNRDGVDKDTTQMLMVKDVAEGAVKRIGDAIAKARINGAVPPGASVAGHAPRRVS